MSTLGNDLVREARLRAGLTQAELAVLAGTTQSGIARWESGATRISLDDVVRLVRLCGLDLEVALVPRDASDLTQATRLEALSGEERLRRHERTVRQMRTVRSARGA